MCIDDRGLHSQTIKDKFPIPWIEELLEELHGAAVFQNWILDVVTPIRMDPKDVPKTVFRTHKGHYEF